MERIDAVIARILNSLTAQAFRYESHPYREDGALAGIAVGDKYIPIDQGNRIVREPKTKVEHHFYDMESFVEYVENEDLNNKGEFWVECDKVTMTHYDPETDIFTEITYRPTQTAGSKAISENLYDHEALIRRLELVTVTPPETMAILRSISRTKTLEASEGDETTLRVSLGTKGAKADLPKTLDFMYRPFEEFADTVAIHARLQVESKDPKDPLRFSVEILSRPFLDTSRILAQRVKARFPSARVYIGRPDATTYVK